MLKVQEIRELIKLLDQSSIDELVYEEKECKIKLKKNKGEVGQSTPTQKQTAPAVEALQPIQNAETRPTPEQVKEEAVEEEKTSVNAKDTNLHKIVSPMVGTFYSSPSPEDPAYVTAGSKVSPDSIVCIVEAMKLFNEIEAEVKGEIVEILVENGQLVEYGQPLFLVKPE